MSRFISIGSFPVCIPEASSIEAAYEAIEPLPDVYNPLKASSLYEAMALYWRAREFKITLTRSQSNLSGPLPAENIELIAPISQNGIVTEEDLICRNVVSFVRAVTVGYTTNGDVTYSASITIDLRTTFIIGSEYYFLFSIEVFMSPFSLAQSVASEFATEFYAPATTGLGTFDFDIPESSFSKGVSIHTDLFCIEKSPDDPDVTVGGLSCAIIQNEFWPYQNGNGVPVYDAATGQQINGD